jgi:PPE-repeat protein
MVDYGLLPPEINSTRMYTGPGAGSLVAAAAGWGELAAELHGTAAGFESVISALTSGPWLGPASASLVAAVTPYVTWLQSSAAHSELAASQAAAAASAHATAFALTVPPPVIESNRTLLATLLATNFLGQNAPAIAATEAEYFEFWAQDAAAMLGYASSSYSASQLTQFEEPPEVADPSGVSRQAAAASSAAASNPVKTAVDGFLTQLDTIHDPLADLASSFTGTKLDTMIVKYTALDDVVSLYSKYVVPYVATLAMGVQSTQSFGQVSNGLTAMVSFGKGLFPAAAKAVEGATQAAGAAGAAATNALPNLGGVAAGLGNAVKIGAVSAPPSWAPVNAITNPGVAALNATIVPAASEGVNGLPFAPLGGLGGANRYGRVLPTYGFKPLVMAKPFSAG